jgi:hypothetical protein
MNPTNDEQLGLAVLKDPFIKYFLNTEIAHFVARLLENTNDPEQTKAYLRVGYDPRLSILNFIRDFKAQKRLNCDNIETFYILIDGYLDNRSTRRGQYYKPFDRVEMLEVLKWLLIDKQNKRIEQLILIENLYSKKFTISQQRRYENELAYVKEYWCNRRAKMIEILSDYLPKDLVKITVTL